VLATVLARYWERHGQHLASAARTKQALGLWLEHFGEIAVDELQSIPRQQVFQDWLRGKKMSPATIHRVLTVGKAALNHAKRSGDLPNPPYIQTIPKSQRQAKAPLGRPLEIEEIVKLLSEAKPESLRLFIVYSLATAARPDAVLELALDQCDVDRRLIHLNPPDRIQSNKHRPIVRMPELLVPITEKLKAQPGKVFVVGNNDQPQKSIRTAWRRARSAAGLGDQVNPYSLRHTVARWLRQKGVDPLQISGQLGHQHENMSDVTSVYAPYDPSYQDEACAAINQLLLALRVNCV